MYYNRKKEIIKNTIMITLILSLALVSTHYIYYKFKDERNVDYNSKSLEVVFHEKEGNDITITKVTPVTDSVGLSSHAYTLTVKNNLTEKIEYDIKLIDDLEEIINDKCEEYRIDKNFIKVSIKEDKNNNQIYKLSDLKENILFHGKIKALAQKDYTIRVWIDKDSTLPTGGELHYHGQIDVIETEK